MGFGKMGEWFIGKSILTKHEIDKMFPTKQARQGRVYIIPLFHHSIIPCTMRKPRPRKNPFTINKLHKFRDVGLHFKRLCANSPDIPDQA
jgi:hypothetical protein